MRSWASLSTPVWTIASNVQPADRSSTLPVHTLARPVREHAVSGDRLQRELPHLRQVEEEPVDARVDDRAPAKRDLQHGVESSAEEPRLVRFERGGAARAMCLRLQRLLAA